MYKKEVTYIDYNGTERKESYYFNLSKPELIEMELSDYGSYTEFAQSIIDARREGTIIRVFTDLLQKSYGEKSSDGRYFNKSPEILSRFIGSPAYESIFMELTTDAKAAAEFFTQILPADLRAEASKIAQERVANAE